MREKKNPFGDKTHAKGQYADWELGYMLVYVEGRNKDYTTNNIIQLSSFLRL